MSGQTSGSLIILILLGLVSWYYFNKFQESEQNYRNLYYQFEKVHTDNKNMKIRIQDLESYRNDISKTFNVLDKELLVINDHLQSRNNNDNITKTGSGSANVQIITPELINSLLDKSENENNRVNDPDTNEINRVNDLNTNEINNVSKMEVDLQENLGNLENGDYHSEVELEHLNFRLGDSYNRFLINN